MCISIFIYSKKIAPLTLCSLLFFPLVIDPDAFLTSVCMVASFLKPSVAWRVHTVIYLTR